MSEKNRDRHGRWRNITIAFRVSPEENERINAAVRISGLTKQDYITRRLEEMDVTVQGYPRVYKGLRDEMRMLASRLEQVTETHVLDPETLAELHLIAEVMKGMKDGKG